MNTIKKKELKILLKLGDKVADMRRNKKKIQPMVTKLLIAGSKLNISLL